LTYLAFLALNIGHIIVLAQYGILFDKLFDKLKQRGGLSTTDIVSFYFLGATEIFGSIFYITMQCWKRKPLSQFLSALAELRHNLGLSDKGTLKKVAEKTFP